MPVILLKNQSSQLNNLSNVWRHLKTVLVRVRARNWKIRGIISNGITNSECYPYTSGVNGAVETCQLDTSCPSFTVGKRIRLECEEDIQRDIMAFGPVQAIVEVAQDLFYYESGVYQPTMDTPLDRATFIVLTRMMTKSLSLYSFVVLATYTSCVNR